MVGVALVVAQVVVLPEAEVVLAVAQLVVVLPVVEVALVVE